MTHLLWYKCQDLKEIFFMLHWLLLIWQSKYNFFILNIFAAFSKIWLLKKEKKMQILWNYYSQKYSVFSSKKNYCVDAFVCIFFSSTFTFSTSDPWHAALITTNTMISGSITFSATHTIQAAIPETFNSAKYLRRQAINMFSICNINHLFWYQ